MERRLPGCTEGTSAVALASFRSFVRAPQAKLLLLTPVILLTMFGLALVRGRHFDPPAALRPFIGLGAVLAVVFMHWQILQNLFGLDRAGFRMLVLAPVERHEILIGKNLAVAPFVLVLGAIAVGALQLVHPLGATHLLATLLQFACIYLLCCLIGNVASIMVPMATSTRSFRPAKPRLTMLLRQFAFSLLVPLALLPAGIALGIEAALDAFAATGAASKLPVYLVVSALEAPLVLWIYARVVRAEGRLLADREQHVLEVVVADPE